MGTSGTDDVIVVNEADEVIGTMPKDAAHTNGTLHRIAVTYVGDGKGKILVQVRMSGVLDHSSAGHLLPGESYEEAAKRELEEELGIRGAVLEKIGHGMAKREPGSDGLLRAHMFDIFSCVAEPMRLQPDEVRDVYWADPEEVLKDMQSPSHTAEYTGGFLVSLPIYLESLKKR